MSLTFGQLVSGAGAVSTGMRQAEEAERVARQNQLKIEEQNRADELRRRTAQTQAGLQVPNAPQFQGMTGGQQYTASLDIPVPQAPPAAPKEGVPQVTVGPITAVSPPTAPTEPAAATPFGRGIQQVGTFLSDEDERRTLTQQLGRQYSGQAGLGGLFMPQTAGEREQAQQISMLLRGGQLTLPQLRELRDTGRLPAPKAAPQAGVKEPVTAEPATTAQGSQPRSMRNNNPGNLVFNEYTRGLGATGKDKDGFAIFPDSQAGQQASIANLQNYGQRGVNTVSAITNRWSPPNAPGNTKQSTDNYTAYVAAKLGVDPNQPLNMNDTQMLTAMAGAISEFESGHTSPLVGKNPGQTADRVASVAAAPATSGVMYGPSSVAGGAQNPGVQSALMLRQIFAEQYRIAAEVGSPDRAMDALAQVAAIDLGLYKAQADQGVYDLAVTGDASRAMSVLSQFTGIPTQALNRGDGTYDLYTNGRVAQTAIPVDKLADLVRTQVDAGYREQKGALAGAQAGKMFEKDLELRNSIQTELIKSQGNLNKAMVEGKFKVLEEEAKRQGGKLTVDTSNGVALYEKNGQVFVIDPKATTEVRGQKVTSPSATRIALPN